MNHTRLLVRASPTRLSTSGQQSYKGWSSRVGAPSVNFTFPWKAWRLTLWAKPTISSITTLCSNSSEFRRFCFTGVAHPITRTLIVCRFPSNDISRVYLRCLDKLEMWDPHNITINSFPYHYMPRKLCEIQSQKCAELNSLDLHLWGHLKLIV